MGLKRVLAIALVMLIATACMPLSAFADGGLLGIEIEQIDVKMPQLKVYLNLSGQDDERSSDPGGSEYSAMLDGEDVGIVSSESFSNSGEGIAVIYLIDISKSLKSSDFELIKQQMLTGVNAMSVSDTVAIITFGEEVTVLCESTSSKQELTEKIEALELTDMSTRFYDGVKKALDLARVQDENLPDRRVIVAVTDGIDDYAGGSTRQEVLDDVKVDPVPMYALGIYKGSMNDEKQQSLDALGEFSRSSGGLYYQMGMVTFEEAFVGMDSSIDDTQVLTLDCGLQRADGKMHELYVALESGGRKFDDNCQVLLGSNMKDELPPVITNVNSGDKYSVTLTFSEDVSGAADIANYEVFNSDGEKVLPTEAKYTGDGVFEALVTFDVELGGEYTIEVSGIFDTSDTPNALEPVSKTFLVDNVLDVDATVQDVGDDEGAKTEELTLYYIIGGGTLAVIAIIVLIVLLIKRKKKRAKGSVSSISSDNIPMTRPLQTPPIQMPPIELPRMPVHFAVTDKSKKASTMDKSISGSLIIGRSKDCDIIFDDDEMSRHHCELTLENGRMYANDLMATNTTIVNGVPIHERIRLNSGDVLLVGQTEIRVTWKEEQV